MMASFANSEGCTDPPKSARWAFRRVSPVIRTAMSMPRVMSIIGTTNR